jgi:sec-independent protein translocase protein TatC
MTPVPPDSPHAEANGPDRDRPGEVRKTVLEHLMELRARIIACLVLLAVTCAVAWFFYEEIMAVVRGPLEDYNAGLDGAVGVKLQAIKITEPFVFILKLGMWGGLILASPFILSQIWAFVSPGLYSREKRAMIPIFTVGIFFFAGGAYFCYRFVIPLAIAYLVPFGVRLGASVEPTLSSYLSFFVMLHVAFGLVFETPLVILALAVAGIVTARGLLRQWRYVCVGAFVLGAVLTPPDVITQVMMAATIIVLYFGSVILAWVFGRKRKDSEESKDNVRQGDAETRRKTGA